MPETVELAALTRVAVLIAAVIAASTAAAAGRPPVKKQSDFDDDVWDTSLKQEDFDGMPLPEDSESPVTSTQLTPVIVKVGQRYGVPSTEVLTKEKEKPGVKEFFLDNLVGASIGSLVALGSVAMVMMATKAMLFALGAILLMCLSSGWTGGAMHKSDKTGTVYEVIAKPQITHGHSYSSEVHYEPYTAPPPPVIKDFAYGYRHI